MCQTKAQGGKRCASRIARDKAAAAKVWDSPDAPDAPDAACTTEPTAEPAPVGKSAPSGLFATPSKSSTPPLKTSRVLNPGQDALTFSKWPGVKANVTIKRDIVTADKVLTATPGKGGFGEATDVTRNDLAPDGGARLGVVTVEHPTTGEYVVYRATVDDNGGWDVGRPLTVGNALPKPQVAPDWLR